VLDLVGRTGPGANPGLDELSGDLAGAVGAVDEWRGAMRFLTDPRDAEFVYWRSGARPESAELAGAPVEVARRLRETFLPGLTGLVLASATLTTGGSFRYVRDRLGLDEDTGFGITERVYPSPFDFPRQLAAFVAAGAEAEGAVALLALLARRLQRNMLVLFTSHRALRTAARALAQSLEGILPVWAQEVDGTAVELARRFREARGAVLLGTASFWEGVDFPGEALEVLVLERLPFPVPTDPLIEARCERIEAEGESGFARVMVPEAILRFRQGIGRLVRRRSDRGVVVLLDPRIVGRSYGKLFQRGLPVPLRVAQGGEDLVVQAEAFLAGDVRRSEGAA
jgi:ATP-dependent DNA helicase DinG